MDLNSELLLQLTWHWDNQLRPRLEGLTDDEYLWAPVPGAWNLRRRAEPGASSIGGGDFVIDFDFPEPEPAPVTTIAWRFGHLLVGVFGERNATYFGGEPVDYQTFDYPGTADAALSQLDDMQARWVSGVQGLGEDGLRQNCVEDGFTEATMAALVLHIHREVIHHGAEICLLRDLYAHRADGAPRREPC